MKENSTSPTPITDSIFFDNIGREIHASRRLAMDACFDLEVSLNEARSLAGSSGYCLQQIIDSLPSSKDWLDPNVERLAKHLIEEIKKIRQ